MLLVKPLEIGFLMSKPHIHFRICCRPHPFPKIVRDFHAVIGEETKKQCLESFGSFPDILLACVGGGSNAMGLFHPFVKETLCDLLELKLQEAELILTNMLHYH